MEFDCAVAPCRCVVLYLIVLFVESPVVPPRVCAGNMFLSLELNKYVGIL